MSAPTAITPGQMRGGGCGCDKGNDKILLIRLVVHTGDTGQELGGLLEVGPERLSVRAGEKHNLVNDVA